MSRWQLGTAPQLAQVVPIITGPDLSCREGSSLTLRRSYWLQARSREDVGLLMVNLDTVAA